MIYQLPFILSLVGASLAVPSFLRTSKSNNVDLAEITDPNQIGTPTNQTGSQPPSNPGVGGVYLCHDINWERCNYTVFPIDTCFDMNQEWNATISSIGPDNGTMIILFTETNCTGNSTQLLYPGRSNLLEDNEGKNDQVVSVNVLPAPANAPSNSSQIV